ncbi:MAG TPA: TonB-dependent receptor [Phenylobacterium sp.]|nr:TonB-dependent receptor [Phenylobacterium sp.]
MSSYRTPAARPVSGLRALLILGASAGALNALALPAFAQSTAGSNVIEELVITAEKREQSLQDVAVAVSAFTSAKRELVGINSIQDMTNFTPGLQYNSSTDRISLRGVGRQTNVLSADASVANYNDGVYETFAVQAGRSTLFLDRVEVLRGPQGTLYGRNAIGGALNEISKRPTETPQGEFRISYGSYNHTNVEASYSGPITDWLGFRLAGNWEKQDEGYTNNLVPGMPDEGNVIDQWFEEGQLQAKFGERFEAWIKVAGGQWRNGAGGPGSASGGWTPSPYPTYEDGVTAVLLNPGYGCNANTTNVVNLSPTGCANPAVNSPWTIARAIPYKVTLPVYATVASQFVWHADNFDIKYIAGGVHYHYILTGPNGPDQQSNTLQAPISSYTLPGGLVIHPLSTFKYEEDNSFFSHEINVISTGDSDFQWVGGAYYFRQNYTQPVSSADTNQAQLSGPFGLPSFFCAQTGGVCAPVQQSRWFDNRPKINAISYAAFGQVDWKFAPTWKTTLGLRYSHDRKFGSESVRLTCFAVSACYAPPEFDAFIPGGIPVVDLTQLPTVVDASNPKGVSKKTVYDPATGFATREYDAEWSAVTGTAGLEWTPDEDTLAYAKYSKGYKSGGLNIGIFTVLSFSPWTDKETVDSFEVGLKKTFMGNLQTNFAVFYYDYKNLQIPVRQVNSSGGGSGLSTGSTNFYNVPKAVSQGVEMELTWQPIDNLQILFNYSYLDAEIKEGQAVDIADPAALDPQARPLQTVAQCAAVVNGTTVCPADSFTTGLPNGGFERNQNLSGNALPNAPKNKVALNVNYTWHLSSGSVAASASYIWRDKQYGNLFSRSYNQSPTWDQVDVRVTWTSEKEHFKVIAYGKNIFDQLGYDAGAYGNRLAGNINSAFGAQTKVIQGIAKTYSVTPPALYGVEFQYKF